MSHPSVIACLNACLVGWMLLNGAAPVLGLSLLHPPPFAGVACAASITSLYFVVVILTTQCLAERRQRLSVFLAA